LKHKVLGALRPTAGNTVLLTDRSSGRYPITLPLPHLNAEKVVEQRNDKVVVQRLDTVFRVEVAGLPESEIYIYGYKVTENES